ncbi:MAG: MGMT family protein [Thiofilum sp.]|uniref:MGMT family protein n=1 Tax=Thiofilum sp. TaxID=2212733 RepID=UPI0025D182B8|nr:MGMT family protein [Thiofilum sp.]MBK8451850.1 MGMT family protein [Thiofilum sp.]
MLQNAQTTLNYYQQIYAKVRTIPLGKIATYGDIARMVGLPRHARMVGNALHALPLDTDVPWQRVINAQGSISLGKLSADGALHQRLLLEAEGVVFQANGKVNLKVYRWRPSVSLFDNAFEGYATNHTACQAL